MRAAWFSPSLLLLLAACATQPPAPQQQQACYQEGEASWYGPQPGHSRTADGEHLDAAALTAAHRTLPFGTRVNVTNLENGRSVLVRITDRGPHAPGRIIDLSVAAARVLAMRREGVARVRLQMPPGALDAGSTVATRGVECPLARETAS